MTGKCEIPGSPHSPGPTPMSVYRAQRIGFLRVLSCLPHTALPEVRYRRATPGWIGAGLWAPGASWALTAAPAEAGPFGVPEQEHRAPRRPLRARSLAGRRADVRDPDEPPVPGLPGVEGLLELLPVASGHVQHQFLGVVLPV